MNAAVKLSSPATREFWEVPVRFEDAHLLALDKPAGLAVSPDRVEPDRPNLMGLLHAGIAAGRPWATACGFSYLSLAHRRDADVSGIVLLAKSKPVLVALANWFGSAKGGQKYVALVRGTPTAEVFEINARLTPHPTRPGRLCVDAKRGKFSRTRFTVAERFSGYSLVRGEPLTDRAQQVRAHLRHAGLPVVGDDDYGGHPLWLSRLKPSYRLKAGRTERPLIARPALHVEEMTLPHPVTGTPLIIHAPWPKDLCVAVKYLRQYATVGANSESAGLTNE
ncbi:MAG: hypothetical protein KIS67_11830 [Verrucomicrobiae bacterium]|nr:hypothetical protein [Verrucomicrobiae bacterium]